MLPKGQRNLVTRDCCGDAVGFATLHKAPIRQLAGIDFTAGPWPDSGAVGSSSLGLLLNFVGWGWRQQRRSSACAITACTTSSHVLPRLAINSPPAISIRALADSLRR